MKLRRGPDGAHLFDRVSGLNILLDEVEIPVALHDPAPRYVSIALTNACELKCPFCYAPKTPAQLDVDVVLNWLRELDAGGCLGVGFGGGEPTAHRDLPWLVRETAKETRLAVTMTTHGHRIDEQMAERLKGSLHFIRVSMDGVGETYESIRGRPFAEFLSRVTTLANICPFGINVVVNEDTVLQLEEIAELAVALGASELLLLLEQQVGSRLGMSNSVGDRLTDWVRSTRTGIRLAISEAEVPYGLPLADPFRRADPLSEHVHIDAKGTLKENAFTPTGLPIGLSVMESIHALKRGAT